MTVPAAVSMPFCWTKDSIDLSAVHRELQWAEAAELWEIGTWTRYQFGECAVDVFSGVPGTVFIHGPTEITVRRAARNLRYADTDGTVSTSHDLERAS